MRLRIKKYWLQSGFLVVILLVIGVMTIGISQRSSKAAQDCPDSDVGIASTSVTIPATGNYQIWSRLNIPDASHSSYYVEVDGTTCLLVSSKESTNNWNWIGYQNGDINQKATMAGLNQGSHTIRLLGKDAGVKLDRVLFIQDSACTPTGTGDNCSTPPPATTPGLTISGVSAGQEVTGEISIGATPINAPNFEKVSFYIDNTFIRDEANSPLCLAGDSGGPCNPYDTKQLKDGTHIIKVVMSYDGGKIVEKTVSFTSKNSTSSSKSGDINGDNQVDIIDLSILLTGYDKTGSGLQADLNKDGAVNIIDLSILLANWSTP